LRNLTENRINHRIETVMKRTTPTILAAAMLCCVFSHRADAQERRAAGTGELPEFLKVYDIDGDGVLSVEERQAFEKAVREARPPRPGALNRWDTDGDGVLSDEEKAAARTAISVKIEAERTKRFNQLDVNTDGFLDATELAAIPRITPTQVAAMIAHLDKADATTGLKDGKVSLAEFTAALRPVEPPFPPMPRPPAGPPAPPTLVPPPLRQFDADRNGVLSPAEYAAFVLAADTSADGVVSLEEWTAYLLATRPDVLPPPPTNP